MGGRKKLEGKMKSWLIEYSVLPTGYVGTIQSFLTIACAPSDIAETDREDILVSVDTVISR